MDKTLIAALKNSELFSSLDENKCNELIKRMMIVELEPGEILYKEDSAYDCMYVLVSGLLAVTTLPKGVEKIIRLVRPGKTVGEIGMFARKTRRRPLTIKAVHASKLLKLNKKDFDEYFSAEPKML